MVVSGFERQCLHRLATVNAPAKAKRKFNDMENPGGFSGSQRQLGGTQKTMPYTRRHIEASSLLEGVDVWPSAFGAICCVMV